MRKALWSVWMMLLLALSLSSIAARADSFSVTGTALSSSQEQAISFLGALSGSTVTAEGPGEVGIFNPGGTVHLSLRVAIIPEPDAGFVSLTFGGKTTDIAFGGLVFSGTFVVPTGSPGAIVSISKVPVSMIGNVVAFQDLTLGQGFQTKGPQIFDLDFVGSGTMTLFGEVLENGQVKLDTAGISFSGSVTTVPEPSSMILFGSGIMGIIGAHRKPITAWCARLTRRRDRTTRTSV